MKKRMLMLMAAMALLVSVAACKPPKEEGSPESKKVLVSVDGEKITEADLQAELQGKPDFFQKMASSPEGRKQLVSRMVERKLLMANAKKEGVESSSEIEAKVKSYRERLIMEEMRKKISGTPMVATDDQINAYYNEHKTQYTTPETVRLRKIVVNDKAVADKVYKEAKASPNKFEDLAKKYSEDPGTKDRGGEMGFVTQNSLPPEVGEKVFSLKPNEISPVLEVNTQAPPAPNPMAPPTPPSATTGKYQIFQLLEKKDAEVRNLDQVKDQIKRILEFQTTQNKWKDYLDGLKKQAKIEYVDKSLEGPIEPGPGGQMNSQLPPGSRMQMGHPVPNMPMPGNQQPPQQIPPPPANK